MDYLSASHIAQAIRQGSLSATDITQHYLSNIERYNSHLNAFVDVFSDRAVLQARQRDAVIKKTPDKAGPLHGVPVSVKECFLMAGTRSSVNYPPLKKHVAATTSMLVQRLERAGAVILGKTNIPTLLSDAQTFGPLYPQCNNPHDLSRTPGGSTGGGAAALAADMTSLELGSDIGGSIRNPSAFCGLYGFKPTENGHCNDGHVPPLPGSTLGWSAMNSTGPLARRAGDLALACKVLFAPDWVDQHYLPVASPATPPTSLKGLNIGVLTSLYHLNPGSDVTAALSSLQQKLEQAGATVTPVHIDPELAKKLLLCWVSLFGYFMGQTLSWPIRKLFYLRFRGALKDSSLDARAAFKRGLAMDFKAFSRCLAERQHLIGEIHRLYSPYDTVLSPTAMGPAFTHNHQHQRIALDGIDMPYIDYCFPFVALYNLTGMPVLTVPAGRNDSGLPVGLSFAAARHADDWLLAFGELLEQQGMTTPLTQTPDALQAVNA
ncbi:amidase [Alteromonas sp. CYL-A6]|uniref:amidase n=1 Tax=Alteromonas nitratireducens TaxID=3390813 RepID=UPI0034AB3B7C